MVEPVTLDAWLRQEEGFSWILEARQSGDAAERQRATRALAALDKSLRRILSQGTDRGWVRHRQVRYLLLVQEAEGALRLLTLARAVSWLEGPAGPSEPATPASPASPPLPPIHRSAGYYGR